MPGGHAKVHENVRQTVQKDESAFSVECRQGQALELVLVYEAQDRGAAPPQACSSGGSLVRTCSMKTTLLTLDNFVCSDECLVRLDATMFMNSQND